MLAGKFWMILTDPEQPPSKAIDPVIKRSYNRFGIFMDYDCPEGKEYLLQVSYIIFSTSPLHYSQALSA
jgi:hypothetical protein